MSILGDYRSLIKSIHPAEKSNHASRVGCRQCRFFSLLEGTVWRRLHYVFWFHRDGVIERNVMASIVCVLLDHSKMSLY